MEQYIENSKLTICKYTALFSQYSLFDKNLLHTIFEYYDPQSIVNEFAYTFPRFSHVTYPYKAHASVMIYYIRYNVRYVNGYNITPDEYPTEFTGYPKEDEFQLMPVVSDPNANILNTGTTYQVFPEICQILQFLDGKPSKWVASTEIPSRSEQDMLIYRYLIKPNAD